MINKTFPAIDVDIRRYPDRLVINLSSLVKVKIRNERYKVLVNEVTTISRDMGRNIEVSPERMIFFTQQFYDACYKAKIFYSVKSKEDIKAFIENRLMVEDHTNFNEKEEYLFNYKQ